MSEENKRLFGIYVNEPPHLTVKQTIRMKRILDVL